MALPEQIQKQSAAIQDLYKQMNGEGGEETKPEDGDTPPEGETSMPNAGGEVSDTDADNGDAGTSPEPEPTQGGGDEDETLLQRYRTLQGMYNAEVPRLHAENRNLGQRLSQLEQLLSTMNAQKGQQSQSQQTQQPKKEFVTAQDVEDYGDSIEMMRRVTQEGLYPIMHRLANLENAIKQFDGLGSQVKAVATRQAQTAEQVFWGKLTELVPDWQAINNNEGFKNWLMELDPMTGLTRQAYLEDAQNVLDATRVASIFNAWPNKESTGNGKSAQTTTTASSELGKQVAPGKTKSSGAPKPNVGKKYSLADIQKFYDDVRKGLYRDRPKERSQLENDIFAAQRDGRIVS